MDKKSLRNKILDIRNNINNRKDKDKEIYNSLVTSDFFINSKNIFIYVSYSSEADTIKVINTALNMDKNVYIPKIIKSNREMKAVQINSIDSLSKGILGILEPESEDGLEDVSIIDLIIMPGVAFDEFGNRVGYGGGYYDKFLSNNNVKGYKIAIAYKEQVINLSNIVEEHDINYDILITDKDIIYNRKK